MEAFVVFEAIEFYNKIYELISNYFDFNFKNIIIEFISSIVFFLKVTKNKTLKLLNLS